MKIIEIKNLNKQFKIKEKEKGIKGSIKSIIKPKYKIVEAVNDINFSVEQGEILAFIGPNGAGKSTTIKMLTGILYPTNGEIKVMGLNPFTVISPAVGYKIPVSIFIVVDFPAPFGPIKANTSPCSTEKLILFTALIVLYLGLIIDFKLPFIPFSFSLILNSLEQYMIFRIKK